MAELTSEQKDFTVWMMDEAQKISNALWEQQEKIRKFVAAAPADAFGRLQAVSDQPEIKAISDNLDKLAAKSVNKIVAQFPHCNPVQVAFGLGMQSMSLFCGQALAAQRQEFSEKLQECFDDVDAEFNPRPPEKKS